MRVARASVLHESRLHVSRSLPRRRLRRPLIKPQGPLQFWNRAQQRLETEAVFSEAAMRWYYESRLGRLLNRFSITQKLASHAYGAYQGTGLSAQSVPEFIRKYRIREEEFDGAPYPSFNDFFIRPFRAGARRIEADPARMPAFAEGRYLAYRALDESAKFPVKGMWLTVEGLLEHQELSRIFAGGPAFIARLCPTDYHRFHYPDAGRTLERFHRPGDLHSVNPIALAFKPDILMRNDRWVSVLETRQFGRLAYIEVGAICVGKIVQTHPDDREFARGEQKGYFLFGGSTVILLGEKGSWEPDSDLIEKTQEGLETFVQLGEPVARRISLPRASSSS